jgi:hypothetical protein
MTSPTQTARTPAFDPGHFATALLDPDAPLPEGIIASHGITPSERFAVYRNNVVQGLITALEARFPIVRRVVGEEFFAAAARVHAMRNPPHSPIMALYGEDFPDFLASFAPCAELPYLADLARIETARTRAYHAADAEPLPAETFANLLAGDLAGLRMKLHPSLSIIASPHPVATIFAMNNGAQPFETFDALETWEGEELFVARVHDNVDVCLLPPGGADFLATLAARATLAEATEAGLGANPEFNLAVMLACLIRSGLVTELSSTPTSDL